MEPNSQQSVFAVTSNSTITGLSFDSTSKQLSFIVTGDPGTTGYVNVFIPKSLINDTAYLKVYLDNNQITYETQSLNEGWILAFSYHHSTHIVTINLQSANSIPSISVFGLDWVKIAILVFMGIVVATVATGFFLFKGKRKAN
jgi:hypothetical protein